MTDLLKIPVRAADYIERNGWLQGAMKAGSGAVCLTGALRECSQEPGDFQLLREVYRWRNRGEEWNDADGRTADEVVDELRRPVTEEDLQATFGPQADQIVTLTRRAARLTHGELHELSAAWEAGLDASRKAAWDAAREAVREVAGQAVVDAAWDAAREAGGWDTGGQADWDKGWDAARDAARDAALALAMRDLLITTPEGTRHYLALTAPWREVIGHVCSDDADLMEGSRDGTAEPDPTITATADPTAPPTPTESAASSLR